MPLKPDIGSAETVGKQTGGVGGNGIKWTNNPWFGNGKAAVFVLALEAGIAKFTEGFAQQVEDYAKENAPWEDRTGEAREGLTAKGEQRLTKYTITLFHTVEYGLWLEVRWSGKYAIIRPTLEVMGPRLMAELATAGLGGIISG